MVGEKGISLSGGQKQRINIARALYFDTPITLFDDSFSALDAHVGHAVFQNAIMGSLRGRTRILVTHALHFLPNVDRILVLDHGAIVEEGSYAELIARGGTFSTLIKDFGTNEVVGEQALAPEVIQAEDKGEVEKKKVLPATALMQTEERYKGSVGWQSVCADSYWGYALADIHLSVQGILPGWPHGVYPTATDHIYHGIPRF